MIQLFGFAPDIDPTTPGIITDCENLIPTLKGYAGGFSGEDISMPAIPDRAMGAAVLTRLDGSFRFIVGTPTKLYEKVELDWVDVSGSTYGAAVSFPWRFAQFGDSTIAANKGDVLQLSNSGTFADISGAPKAATICTTNGFAIVADTNDSTYGDSPDRWWCSALNDVTNWVPDIATQCTTGRLVDSPGGIRAVKAIGDDVAAYKERAMYIGRYIGPPVVWQWTRVPGQVGCASQEAIVDIGAAHIFIGYDDIYMFDGSRPTSIGTPLREWFFDDLDPNYRHLIKGVHDRKNSLVYFFYPRVGGATTVNGCIVFNYKTGKWGLAHRTIRTTVEYIYGGYTWDTLPLTTWDSFPEVAYDSPFWTNSGEDPAYIGTDEKVYSLTGPSVSSSLTSGHIGDDFLYSLLSRVQFKYQKAPASASLTNYYQDILGSAWTADNTVAQASGRFDLLRSSKWHKVRVDFTGDVEISGIKLELQQDGDE